MELVKKYFSWLVELLILLAVVLVINNYLGNKDRVINADGKGYYDYLPAAFIYDDLNFNYLDTLQTNNYDHKMEAEGYIRQVDGKRIDKYFPGVAILWIPFFYGAHYYALNSDEFLANGYSLPYQKSIFYAALFFLFLGLLYLRKLLMELGINKVIIFAVQLLFALGTPLIHYVYNDSSFTHVYSFSLITIFAYLTHQFITYKSPKYLLLSGLVFGFIVIIRPVNIISLGIPLLFFSSFKELKMFLLELFKKHLKLVIGFGFIVGIIGSTVPILWHYQTGHFVVWGYQNEGFNFLSPAIFSFLFSFRKGMFLHTPLLLIAFFGGLWAFVAQKKRYQSVVYLGYFLALIYILSSWWSWWYGASFGSRPIIDFYVIFAMGLANLFQYLKSTYSKVIVVIIGLGLVCVNLIQVYQFKVYIIDYSEMTYDKFQKIGLHTEDKYRGLFYRKITPYSVNEIVYSQEIEFDQDFSISGGTTQYFKSIYIDDSINLDGVNLFVIKSDVEIMDGTSEFILSMDDRDTTNFYWHGQNVFCAILKENVAAPVDLFYWVKTHPQIGRITIGINSKTDDLKIKNIQLLFIHKE